MVGLFLDSSPLLLAEVEAGVARHDTQTIERAAHALKGAMQNISAAPAARAASALEETGRMGNMRQGRRIAGALEAGIRPPRFGPVRAIHKRSTHESPCC